MNYQIRILSILFFTFCTSLSLAQSCDPTYSKGSECINKAISFTANAPAFSTFNWAFKDASGKSIHSTSDRDPVYVFKDTGTYSVTLNATGATGNCQKSLSITIRQGPTVKSTLLTDKSQCFAGNQFVYIDSSFAASGSALLRVTYLFGDGTKKDIFNPKIGDIILHSVTDPKGGLFNLNIEVEDVNGCVAEAYIPNAIQVFPRIGLSLTSNSPIGCDSAQATITNVTYLNWLSKPSENADLKNLSEFRLDFGDGTVIVGDSITNAAYWTGKGFDGKILRKYDKHGTFNLTLSVVLKNGCGESTTLKSGVTVIRIDPQIIADKDSFSIADGLVSFKVAKGPIPSASFLWNFGDPVSGPSNIDNRTWLPSHKYSTLGPKMISLRVRSGPCDKMAFDTVIVHGPLAQIEAAYDRIDLNRRYQCNMKDTVFFPNNSSFYHNDASPDGEDSLVKVNGKSQFVFNYNKAMRSGDQTALTSAKHLANRTRGSQVARLWTFGDEYAEQCTTSTALKLNLGKNCNYSLDSAPKHMYPNWDAVYFKDHFIKNDSFTYGYFDAALKCHTRIVDTTEPQLHRLIFMKSYPHNFVAQLFLNDTVRKVSMKDEVLIVATKPDASKMTLESGTQCPLDGNKLNYYLRFDMNTGSQSYFAVNYDSSLGKNNFIAFNSGGVNAPPVPGSPLPFIMPYDLTGGYGDQFMKGYVSGELGNDWSKGPTKNMTMGLVVGNGPLDKNGNPQCTDTAWYHNILAFSRLDAEFDVVGGKTSICKGQDVYLKLKHNEQVNISSIRLNNGYPDRVSGYYEDIKYLQVYTGPVKGRNDENVTYKGENWRYNYVVRHTIDEVYGDVILDTIVTAIIKEWKTKYDLPSGALKPEPKKGYYFEDKGQPWSKFLGTCIDSTGMNLKSTLTEYHEQETNVVKHKNKRYRYTNTARTDSVEVAEILHFRAYSIQGFDTLIDGKDTIPGLWKISYKHPEVRQNPQDPTKKDTVMVSSSGAMIPSMFITNVNGCERTDAELLNVGFLTTVRVLKEDVCEGQLVMVEDSIRYWQLGDDKFPWDYPIDPRKFWETPARYLNNREIKKVDWDSTDAWDFERAVAFQHVYDDPKTYVATMVVQDSLGCTDTSYVSINVHGSKPNFITKAKGWSCFLDIEFSDSTTHTSQDSVIWYRWDFGDGSPKSVLKKPSHSYNSYGDFEVKLKIQTSNFCEDSITKTVKLPGPKPLFEFRDDFKGNLVDTTIIYEGDRLFIKNISDNEIDPKYTMNWGDGTKSVYVRQYGGEFEHEYADPGIYNLYLTMDDEFTGTNIRCRMTYPDSMPMPWQVEIHEVVVVLKDTAGGVPSLNSQVSLYPNPSQGQFVVKSREGLTMEHVRLIDGVGRNVPIDVQGLKSGVTTQPFLHFKCFKMGSLFTMCV